MTTKHLIYWLLLVLNIIGLLFILQIDFGLIPLVESGFSEERIQRINNLLSSTGLGVIISTFFYLLLVYFPEKLRARTVRKLIQPRLNTIANMMLESIAYLTFKYNIETNGNDFTKLKFEDLKTIERLENKPMDFKYRLKAGDNWSGNSSGTITELHHFVHEREQVIKKIDEILSLPIIQSENDKIIETLAKLRDCWFYSGVDSYSRMGTKVTVMNFNKGVYDYYQAYVTLSKYTDNYLIEIQKE
jgi:hypothetical protein